MKDLPTTVEELQALLRQTRDEADGAQRARDDAQRARDAAQRARDDAQRQAAELSATVAQQSRKLQQQERTILELLAALRGKRRERVDPSQLLLFEIGELETLLEESRERASASRPQRRKHGRRLLPDHLPREEVLHEIPESQRLCPRDGQVMQVIRYEVSQQLEYEPAKLKVLVHKRAVYACSTKHDEAALFTAPKPPQPIDKGLPGPGLLAALVLWKFGDHLPGYRLEDILFRHGVEIRRSTIYDWLAAAADLAAPLEERMQWHVLESKVIHTDDTQVKLIDHDLCGTRTARFWAYVGDRGHPYIVYDFTESRQREGPARFLRNFQGYLQADAYGGYDGIYLRSGGNIVEVACWTHCRRYWWQAREQDPPRAHHALAVIARLYDIERAAKDVTATQRQALRAEHAAPLLADLKAWLDKQDLLPKSLIGKAATYTWNQWTALNRYLEDGDLSIDNNVSERTVKPVAIGRKNWLFVGSPAAGRRAATLMSLIASCKHNRVEPQAYLRDVFTRLPQLAAQTSEISASRAVSMTSRELPQDDLAALLPDRWLAEHPQHRWTIADRRQKERAANGRL